MANTIKIKNSSVIAKVPLTTDLAFGEIALNYADGKIYYKKSDSTIQSISGGGGGGSALTISDEDTSLTAAATSMNFKGLGVVATTVGNAVTVTIPGQLGNLDGGIPSSTYDGIITVIDAGTP